MERNDSSSESDERMKKRFSFEFSGERAEDDEVDDEKDKKKSERKVPSKSLFFGAREGKSETERRQVEQAEKETQATESEQRRSLLKMILRQERPTDFVKQEETEDGHSEEAAETAETEAGEQGEGNPNHEEATQGEEVDAESKVEETEQLEAELQEIVEDKIVKLQAESEEVSAAEDEQTVDIRAAALAADIGFLEKVSAKIKDGAEAPAAIEASVAESLAEADEVVEDGDVEGVEVADDPSAEEAPASAEAEEPTEATPPDFAVPTATAAASLAAAGAGSASTNPTRASRTATRTTARSTTTPTLHNPLPPIIPPRPPHSPFVQPPGGPVGPNVSPYPTFNPNVLSSPTPEDDTVRMNDVYRRNRNTGKIILAGLIGYAIGRRGGRKRTEARLQPEIDKGQKQVKELEHKLEFSEQAVRQKAAEGVRLRDELSERVQQKNAAETGQQRIEERLREQEDLARTASNAEAASVAQVSRETLTPLQAQILNSPESRSPSDILAEAITPPRPETGLGKEILQAPLLAAALAEAIPQAVESENLQKHEAYVLQADRDPALATVEQVMAHQAETLQPATVAASETAVAKPVEQQRPQVQEQVRKQAAERATFDAPKPVDVQVMTMPELLSVAEKIDVGSGNLKDMYEHRRIDAVNLRRVIAEYAAGKNIQETLHRSLEAEEMHRELRNEVKTDSTGIFDGTGAAAKSPAGSAQPSQQTSSASAHTQQSPEQEADKSRPLDIPPPSTSFMPGQLQDRGDMREESTPETTISSAVVVAVGVAFGAIVAAILLLALHIV